MLLEYVKRFSIMRINHKYPYIKTSYDINDYQRGTAKSANQKKEDQLTCNLACKELLCL